MRWNDHLKAAVKRKEAAWKEVLGAKDEDAKQMSGNLQRRKVKRSIYQSKKVHEQFGRKMNQDGNGNGKLF